MTVMTSEANQRKYASIGETTNMLAEPAIKNQYDKLRSHIHSPGGPRYPSSITAGEHSLARTVLALGVQADLSKHPFVPIFFSDLSHQEIEAVQHFFGISGEYPLVYAVVEDLIRSSDISTLASSETSEGSEPVPLRMNGLLRRVYQNMDQPAYKGVVSDYLETLTAQLDSHGIEQWYSDHLFSQLARLNTPALRNSLVERHMHLVDNELSFINGFMDPSFDRMDLYQSGVIGLIDAVNRYDNSGNFPSYAKVRIYGSMIDLIRAMSPFSKWAAQNYKQVEAMVDRLWHELEREPRDDDLANRLGKDIGWVRSIREMALPISRESLKKHEDGEEVYLVDLIPDPTDTDPLDQIEACEQSERIHSALHILSPKEALIIVLYYLGQPRAVSEVFDRIPGQESEKWIALDYLRSYGHMDLPHIGELFGIPRSSTSFFHQKAKAKLCYSLRS
jgi:RNA polymerase sigma factor FliA